MDPPHKTAITAVEHTIAASEALRATLRLGEATGRKMIKKLESGVPVSGVVSAAGGNAADIRQTTNDALAIFEPRRHEIRIAFIGTSLDEGLSIGDIGRSLGVSRQLAARFAKEARGED